jgi:hypothetical protein
MATYRTLLIRGHIYAIEPCMTKDGIAYTHLVVEDSPDGATVVEALKATAGEVIHDSKTDDPAKLDDKYKIHVYEENEFTPRAVIKAPEPGVLEEA